MFKYLKKYVMFRFRQSLNWSRFIIWQMLDQSKEGFNSSSIDWESQNKFCAHVLIEAGTFVF